MKVLLGVTGGVAAKLTPKMVHAIIEAGHEIKVIVTEKSSYFQEIKDLNDDIEVLTDTHEWEGEKYLKDMPVAHIELRKWADVIVIVPLTANTLAKIANGIADNLLTCVMRAWEVKKKPIIIAPAMNTAMWEHPVTDEHIQKLHRWHRMTVVGPISKNLACGDTGKGAMANINDIVDAIK
ncbi:flavoprotein [Patescibacteria group bacterium]